METNSPSVSAVKFLEKIKDCRVFALISPKAGLLSVHKIFNGN